MGINKYEFLRVAGLICSSVSLVIGTSSLAGAASGSEDAAAPEESVYVVEARSADGSIRRGSAVAIARDTFITNCHVTRGAQAIQVGRDAYTWRATVRAGSGELDLCVLSAPTAAARAPRVRDTGSVAVGEPIYAVGFPVGQGISIRSGTIKALHQHANSSVIQVSATWELGSSGGGLFDGRGNLVGVLSFKMLAGEAQYFALPTNWISRVQQGMADTAPAFWERPAGALPSFLAKIATDSGNSRGAGTSGLTVPAGSR